MANKQASYARNLGGTPLGIAVYDPVELCSNSGRVGDIAFFDDTGRYRWIRNAFDSVVNLGLSYLLTIKRGSND
jgi:hypothetical protein